MNKDKYEVVIGLEVHAQLLTNTKLFSGDLTTFGSDPNTNVSPISLAHPGTLPLLNKEVVALAVKLGIALNCTIAPQNYFARKNYFYPDLPKGFQTSQHSNPICIGGYLTIEHNNSSKNILLNRIHMEEDAGKSIHDLFENYSAIDLNRAGTPLLEIVTEPCLHSADEVYLYLTELRKILRWLNVCDGNMEEGSMRCDANISIRLKGVKELGTRVEVKNLNSIRNVKKAIEIEFERLIKIIEAGKKIKQETRSYNADNNTTFSLRSKEEADDYRYFPEPDLSPINITDDYLLKIKKSISVLPSELQKKYIQEFNLTDYDAATLCTEKDDAHLFETIAKEITNFKSIANWIIGPIKNYCNEKNISIHEFPLTVKSIIDLINFTNTGKIHFNIASTKLLQAMINDSSLTIEEQAIKLNLLQENNEEALIEWVSKVIESMPDKVKEYKNGKKNLLGLFAGQVKKMSAGKADMNKVNILLEQQLTK